MDWVQLPMLRLDELVRVALTELEALRLSVAETVELLDLLREKVLDDDELGEEVLENENDDEGV